MGHLTVFHGTAEVWGEGMDFIGLRLDQAGAYGWDSRAKGQASLHAANVKFVTRLPDFLIAVR